MVSTDTSTTATILAMDTMVLSRGEVKRPSITSMETKPMIQVDT
jgi:hypothetical protein